MRGFGIFLMIVSGVFDIISIAMVGSSSFESFKTVILISSITFFVGLLLTIFGGKSAPTPTPSNNTNDTGFTPPPSDESQWICAYCGEKNTNTLRACLKCGELKRVKSVPSAKTYHSREPKENEWKCKKCGIINQNYVGTCSCGNRKQDNDTFVPADTIQTKSETIEGDTQTALNNKSTDLSVADEIKQFKELLDMGAITQDEYDRKKKELLGF